MRLGDKVKFLRQHVGLSQQQLAGSEMSRVFISLVESGKSMPSPENLRTIAQRLGKPVAYFLTDDPSDNTLDALTALLESVDRDFDQPTDEHVAVAYRKLQQAQTISLGLNHSGFDAQISWGIVRCLRRMRRYEEAREACEQAVEAYRVLTDPKGMAMTYREMGDCAYYMDDFPGARKAYEKALLYVGGLKTMQLLRTRTLTMLGVTLFRLGEYQAAVQCYGQAIDECSLLDDPEPLGDAAVGLGCVMYHSGDLEGAREWLLKGSIALKAANSAAYVGAQHNLALVEMARGNGEAGYVILRECMQVFQTRGRSDHQAAVMEELAEYWVGKHEYAKAEALCWDALDLLELKDHGVLRGRLYRMLGRLAAIQGNIPYARNLFRVSLQLLRRLKVNREAEATLAEMERISHRCDA